MPSPLAPCDTGEFFARFSPVRLEHRPLLERLSQTSRPRSSHYIFSSLFLWAEPDRILWRTHRDTLLIYEATTDTILMPWGGLLPPRELAAVADRFLQSGKRGCIERVPPEYLERFPEAARYFDCRPDEAGTEYVYSTQALAAMPGPAYKDKRNLIRRFERACPDREVVPLSRETAEPCLSLQAKWLQRKGRLSPSAQREDRAIRAAFAHFEALGLEGVAIRSGGRVVAFSIFCRDTDSMYLTLFEKYDADVPGSAQAIVREAAACLLPRCPFVNWDDDMGVPNIRQSKLSYRPAFLLEHWLLRRRPPG